MPCQPKLLALAAPNPGAREKKRLLLFEKPGLGGLRFASRLQSHRRLRLLCAMQPRMIRGRTSRARHGRGCHRYHEMGVDDTLSQTFRSTSRSSALSGGFVLACHLQSKQFGKQKRNSLTAFLFQTKTSSSQHAFSRIPHDGMLVKQHSGTLHITRWAGAELLLLHWSTRHS